MARPQTVLTVVAARRLTPHLVRLTLGGEQFDAVHARWAEKGATDQYVKLLFADPALGLEPPYDLDALRERLAPEQLPVRRTYTVRRMDAAARTMDVDFVVHGASDDGAAPGRDGGLAGAWAASEPVGQQVAFLGPGGAYRPDPTADWHLLAGDESALPAIAAALEDLAATDAAAAGLALIEVTDARDEVPLTAPAGVEVRWLHRGGPFTPETTRFAAAVEDAAWREGRVHAFVHGEREQVKRVRAYLTDVRGVDRRQLSVSAYWAYGRAEDVFQAEKQTPAGQIFEDGTTGG
ncbi:siderophore-interacting protein [Micrococcus luteus]|uniref:siderophore-interacting protein n=1 Tax=Micrococcus TaxID=1269 RepID=UPI0006674E98|nr:MULTISPECIES: siderophore-interacting protein [Micrococcus]MBF0755639.1 siderophore-interacting protein [Micrococcus aloeverae]MBU8763298.1 siderophore-interacting protein [Micrococcus luteus]MCF8559853.1 siderophore-interacting protein [Micrococcus yunnanensis]MCV7468733.1 siderophore-interacting protein [Micrococcus luteus]MCV7494049.1 siderophore-interacting protein [Micrococcus luteus]